MKSILAVNDLCLRHRPCILEKSWDWQPRITIVLSKRKNPQPISTGNHMYTRLSMSEPKIPQNNHTLTLIATDIRIRGERRWEKLARTTNESSTTGIENSKYGIEKAWLPRAPPKSQISGERFATREAFSPNLRLELAIKGGGWVGIYIWGSQCWWFKRTVRIGRFWAWLRTIGRPMMAV